MHNDQILVSEDSGIVTITLNRPERLNAFIGHMRRDLGEALEEYAFYDGFDFRSRAKANGRLLMSRMGYVDTRIFHKEVKAVVATYDGKCLEFLPTAPAGEEWNFLAETLKTEASSQSELGENLLQAFSLCRPNWPFEPQS